MGLATARLLAASGAHISLGDINEEALHLAIASLPGSLTHHIFRVIDVQNAATVDEWIEATVEHYGKLDCAVNMAGIIPKAQPVTIVTEEEWDLTFAVNTKGVFNCLRAQIRAMEKGEGGSIVSSSQGL